MQASWRWWQGPDRNVGSRRGSIGSGKGYRILEIFEVYDYQIIQYSRETDQGGLFVDYINTFLELKAEASGYPNWVQSPEDEERYIHSFRES